MNKRNNTLLLFAKVPEAGMTKTRLSVLRDGIFTPEDAADLFGCMLLDVVETVLAAFAVMTDFAKDFSACESSSARCSQMSDCSNDIYQLVISTTPASNVDKMREFLEAEFGALDSLQFPVQVISDSGDSFDAHYNDAFNQVWDMGADCILSMGADMPALTARDIQVGFEELHALWDSERTGIVFAPDQEMGVSTIGWNRTTTFDHDGVFYNEGGLTVLPAYINKARAAGIDAVWLPPIPDIDTMADLAHNLTLIDALGYCAKSATQPTWPHRTSAKLCELGCSIGYIAPNELRDPREKIDA